MMMQLDQIIADALAGSPETHVAMLAREVVRLRAALAVVVPELTGDDLNRYSMDCDERDALEFGYKLAACRIRITPRTTKSIATRATVRATFPDGAMIADSIACESGLSGEMMQFSADRWELSKIHLQASGAKYIMLEIQREGEP